jgi:NADH-quinone oxidoreductase subunit N
MLSLLGMPLTAGFMGKVLVFIPALNSGNALITTLVVVAVIGTAISAYYYLRLIVVMFFRERTTDWFDAKISASMTAALILTVVGVLYFGLFSDRVIHTFSSSPTRTVIAADK